MSELELLRDALSTIGTISRAACRSGEYSEDERDAAPVLSCTPKALPPSLQLRAARTATLVNPVNAPAFAPQLADSDETARMVSDPLSIALLTSKYWGAARRRLSVSFMEPTPADLQARILTHLNAWQCGIQFVPTGGTGQVRISRGAGGYWSYLGTDVLHIATNRPTMNLESFTMNTPESEFKRVIRHEGGHTLGFPHEHMRRELVSRVDPQKAYDFFLRTQGWSPSMVDQQVLTALDERSIMGTSADQTSIMCYQLPAEITRDRRPILGGTDINPSDRTFAQRIYPPVGATPPRREDDCAEAARSFDLDEAFLEEPVFVD